MSLLTVLVAAAVLEGPFPLLITPWSETAKLDLPVLVKEADYVNAQGVGGIIWPTAGEVTSLEKTGEYENGIAALAERAVKGHYQARITAVCPGKDSATAINRVRTVEAIAKRTGAKMAILARPPDDAKDQNMMLAHYRTLAKETTLPVIIQTYNGKSPQPSIDILVQLHKEYPQIYFCIKEESPGQIVNKRMRQLVQHDGMVVFSGWGGKGWIYQGTKIGTRGLITQRAPYAGLLTKVWRRIAAGADASDPELASAYARYLYMLNLGDVFSYGDDEFRGPHLYVLEKLGVFRNRLSRDAKGKVYDFPMTDAQKTEVEARMRWCGLIR